MRPKIDVLLAAALVLVAFAIGTIMTALDPGEPEVVEPTPPAVIESTVATWIPAEPATYPEPTELGTEPETEPPTQPTQTLPKWESLGEFRLTAYCPCEKCCGKWAKDRPVDEDGKPVVFTASGAIAREGLTIAVDPEVIPWGTHVMINGIEYVAQDCGGNIKGNRIDVYFEDHQTTDKFGVQYAEVFVETRS